MLVWGPTCFKKGLGGGVALSGPHGNHYRRTLTNNPPIHHMLLTTEQHVRSRQAGRGPGLSSAVLVQGQSAYYTQPT